MGGARGRGESILGMAEQEPTRAADSDGVEGYDTTNNEEGHRTDSEPDTFGKGSGAQ